MTCPREWYHLLSGDLIAVTGHKSSLWSRWLHHEANSMLIHSRVKGSEEQIIASPGGTGKGSPIS